MVSFLTTSNLEYKLSDGTKILSNINLSIQRGDKIGLLGANGSGKTTLLKILANLLPPTLGKVEMSVLSYYMTQVSTTRGESETQTLLDFLSKKNDNWWLITQILEKEFKTFLDISLPVKTLSGGEFTKVLLAIGFASQADILFLDEPTNHLDVETLDILNKLLNNFQGAFVLVSHKPFFLDQTTNCTWELSEQDIKVYGGNYSFYKEQKEVEYQTALKNREKARKEMKSAQVSLAREQERAARSLREGKQQALDRSMSAMERGMLANQASASAGKGSKNSRQRLEFAKQKLSENQIKTRKASHIILTSGDRRIGNLIVIEDANLILEDKIIIESIDFDINYGDRVCISGANGSGKSCFVKSLLKSDKIDSPCVLLGGNVYINHSTKILYLDQNYSFLEKDKTIFDNMKESNKSLTNEQMRNQLGCYLFRNTEVDKLVSTLSGGEMARLALAVISVAEADLVILDEPTNNIDIQVVEQMTNALNNYRGALIAISHDIDFLSQIGIDKAYRIKNKILQRMISTPSEKELFYQELL